MPNPHPNLQDLTRQDFPLPTLGPLLARLQDEAVFGRGFQFFTGEPNMALKGGGWGHATADAHTHHVVLVPTGNVLD